MTILPVILQANYTIFTPAIKLTKTVNYCHFGGVDQTGHFGIPAAVAAGGGGVAAAVVSALPQCCCCC